MTDSSGGNFDRVLEIEAGGSVSIHGPLELADDQRLLTLYVWLWQADGDGPGAAATAVLDGANFDSAAARRKGGTTWNAMAEAVHGEFRAGPATGMALAILDGDDGSTTPYWWSDNNILLEDTPGPQVFTVTLPTDVRIKVAEALQAIADALTRR